MLAEHFVHDAVLLRLVGGHEEVALDILNLFHFCPVFFARTCSN